jgi:hypothetical protein
VSDAADYHVDAIDDELSVGSDVLRHTFDDFSGHLDTNSAAEGVGELSPSSEHRIRIRRRPSLELHSKLVQKLIAILV